MTAHLADAPICQAFGSSEAWLIKAVHYWLGYSRNVHNGRLWSYNTLEAWSGYTGLKSGALRRVITALRERGVLLTWRPNRRKPAWYSIDYAKLRQIVVASLKANGQWPYSECDRIDHTESDSSDRTQALESYETDQTQLAESDRSDHAIQETNKTQEKTFKQDTQAGLQQHDPTVVVANISNKTSNTDPPGTLSVSSRKKTAILGDELDTTGGDQDSAELDAIFQQFSAEFSTEIPIEVQREMQVAGVSVCQTALDATLEKKRAGDLGNPTGFLRRAVAKQWAPLKKPGLNKELRALLDELDWNGYLADKEWPNRPDEAFLVRDLNELEQQKYKGFLLQQIHNRNRHAAELSEKIRDQWQRIGYDGGTDELIEQQWQMYKFTKLAHVSRNPNYADAYIENLRKRPAKKDSESNHKSSSSDSTSRITDTQSASKNRLSSNGQQTYGDSVAARGGMSSMGTALQTLKPHKKRTKRLENDQASTH